ncbi:nicotinamide riboside transporter PnuC [Aliiglaciecola sp. LCG003]|uniref:nicotinamide riboside transporter PnuC n=1 Tax=Aliiglaciecola sp. LCG003 TaxID=3053655 RepID=UPI0025736474|nr:nicotinamide riboside transporter PnuC [Aliiglaciecola sp. LCG003]WJG08339.1 nicotinamide riboside transporter PnuC [Aliiglaciecola sp. LCG003]
MDGFLQALQQQMQQQSWIEVIAVLFSLAYPWLAARQNILCWPAALLSTSLYIFVFWEVSLPFNSALNAYYMIMAIYGWIKWHKSPQSEELPVRSLPLLIHLTAISILLISGFVVSNLVTMSLSGHDHYLDAMVTVFSVYATYLMANKVLENWLYWIFINAAAAYLYLNNGLFLTGILFVGYFGFALYGFYSWRRSYQQA